MLAGGRHGLVIVLARVSSFHPEKMDEDSVERTYFKLWKQSLGPPERLYVRIHRDLYVGIHTDAAVWTT